MILGLLAIGALLIAFGFIMWSPAAGLVVAGVELIGAAYLAAYVQNHEREPVRR